MSLSKKDMSRQLRTSGRFSSLVHTKLSECLADQLMYQSNGDETWVAAEVSAFKEVIESVNGFELRRYINELTTHPIFDGDFDVGVRVRNYRIRCLLSVFALVLIYSARHSESPAFNGLIIGVLFVDIFVVNTFIFVSFGRLMMSMIRRRRKSWEGHLLTGISLLILTACILGRFLFLMYFGLSLNDSKLFHLEFAAVSLVLLSLFGQLCSIYMDNRSSNDIDSVVKKSEMPLSCRVLFLGGSTTSKGIYCQHIPRLLVKPNHLIYLKTGETCPLDGYLSRVNLLDGDLSTTPGLPPAYALQVAWVSDSMLSGDPSPVPLEPGDSIMSGTKVLYVEDNDGTEQEGIWIESSLQSSVSRFNQVYGVLKHNCELSTLTDSHDRILSSSILPAINKLLLSLFLISMLVKLVSALLKCPDSFDGFSDSWFNILMSSLSLLSITSPNLLIDILPYAHSVWFTSTFHIHRCVVKNPSVIDELSSHLGCIILDNSGTITKGRPQVVNVLFEPRNVPTGCDPIETFPASTHRCLRRPDVTTSFSHRHSVVLPEGSTSMLPIRRISLPGMTTDFLKAAVSVSVSPKPDMLNLCRNEFDVPSALPPLPPPPPPPPPAAAASRPQFHCTLCSLVGFDDEERLHNDPHALQCLLHPQCYTTELTASSDQLKWEEVWWYVRESEKRKTGLIANALCEAAEQRLESNVILSNLRTTEIQVQTQYSPTGVEVQIGDVFVSVAQFQLDLKSTKMTSIGSSNREKDIKDKAVGTWVHKLRSSGATVVGVWLNGNCVAVIALVDEIREEAKQFVHDMFRRGIDVKVTTGSHMTTANAIGERLGIPCSHIFSECHPERKADTVRNLRAYYAKRNSGVIFVGDGRNDSEAMVVADVSFMMGAPLDKPIGSTTADIIVLSKNLKDILSVIKLAEFSIKKVKLNFGFLLIAYATFLIASLGGLTRLTGFRILPEYSGSFILFCNLIIIANSLSIIVSAVQQSHKNSRSEDA
eukprot:GHVH01017153.1.p1 GENE.GHVH01017153.1~~GHVH01017153.1.p1  ORF type:complete len:989 (+),score=158.58 GHVH01017153.1:2683-5649(+)